jgi:hypothetical protein
VIVGAALAVSNRDHVTVGACAPRAVLFLFRESARVAALGAAVVADPGSAGRPGVSLRSQRVAATVRGRLRLSGASRCRLRRRRAPETSFGVQPRS